MLKSFLLTGLVFSVCMMTPSAKTFRLFILSGQSNGVGNGNGDLLPDSLKSIDTSVVMWSDLSRAWKPLKSQRVSPDTAKGIDSLKFGPEMMFAHKMKLRWPKDIIGIVKQVRGGTSIIAWDSDYNTAKWISDMKMIGHITDTATVAPQWPLLERFYKQALAACSTRKDIDSIRVSGFLWAQGEHDGQKDSAAQAYKGNLTKLIGNIRKLTGVAGLPTMFMDSHAGIAANQKTIHDALVRITDSIPATALVLDRDLPTHKDNIHFNTEGMLEFGNRFALAFFTLWDKQNPTNLLGLENKKPWVHGRRVSFFDGRILFTGKAGKLRDKVVIDCRGAVRKF